VSRRKSEFGCAPATKKQPPPVLPGGRWFTQPPVTGAQAPEWIPASVASSPWEKLRFLQRVLDELVTNPAKGRNKTVRRQIEHVRRCIADVEMTTAKLAREPSAPQVKVPLSTLMKTVTMIEELITRVQLLGGAAESGHKELVKELKTYASRKTADERPSRNASTRPPGEATAAT
jgi:hypothetical protein